MTINVSLTHLQQAIGKDGPGGMEYAMNCLAAWSTDATPQTPTGSSSNQDISPSLVAASESIKIIVSTMESKSSQMAVPSSIISLFISHVVLWAFSKTARFEAKEQLSLLVYREADQTTMQLANLLSPALFQDLQVLAEEHQLIFKHAALQLAKLGTWGASLNLALLLQKRSEI
jgi:hypothetical protein